MKLAPSCKRLLPDMARDNWTVIIMKDTETRSNQSSGKEHQASQPRMGKDGAFYESICGPIPRLPTQLSKSPPPQPCRRLSLEALQHVFYSILAYSQQHTMTSTASPAKARPVYNWRLWRRMAREVTKRWPSIYFRVRFYGNDIFEVSASGESSQGK